MAKAMEKQSQCQFKKCVPFLCSGFLVQIPIIDKALDWKSFHPFIKGGSLVCISPAGRCQRPVCT